MKSYKTKNLIVTSKGFTVLELLVVIGIISILVGLVLVGLNNARRHSKDERTVSNVQTVVVGLQQFYSICREYPVAFDDTTQYPCLGMKTLKDIIPDVVSYMAAPYFYASTASDSSPNAACTGFHIGVILDGPADGFASRSGAGLSPFYCSQMGIISGGNDQDASTPNSQIFDIKK
jgi:prepilin-type N-terminal cleavage/methylation domain-containing protein